VVSPARILDEVEDTDGCDYCSAILDEPCEDECDCPTCETERAAQDDYDAWVDRCVNP
jgi:hypothetical protein